MSVVLEVEYLAFNPLKARLSASQPTLRVLSSSLLGSTLSPAGVSCMDLAAVLTAAIMRTVTTWLSDRIDLADLSAFQARFLKR